MDLLAPCRSCLQCLPFFHVSPPSSPRLPAVAPSSTPESQPPSSPRLPAAVPASAPESQPAAPEPTSTDPSQSSEKSQWPDSAPAMQEQDLPVPGKEEDLQDAKLDKEDSIVDVNEHEDLTKSANQAMPISEIIIAPPVSAGNGAHLPEDRERNKTSVPSELPLHVPFINDISFSTFGMMHLLSPITPAAIGAGYPAGEYHPHHHIYQDQHHAHAHSSHDNSQHGHDHALDGHDSLQHEHDKSHHGHDKSHHGHDNTLEGLHHSHHGHDNSHHDHDPQHGHANIAPFDAVSLPCLPSDAPESVHEHHKECSDDNLHHQDNEVPSADNTGQHLQCENSVMEHDCHDDNRPPHDQTQDSTPLPPLETFQSTPDLDGEAKLDGENGGVDMVSDTNGALTLLETYHSEPIVSSGDPDDDDNNTHDAGHGPSALHLGPRRHRHRDHFKDHFKGISEQIKQDGLHLKEEVNKHLQTIITNVNKQAQQIEQSGSFFVVPRANNN